MTAHRAIDGPKWGDDFRRHRPGNVVGGLCQALLCRASRTRSMAARGPVLRKILLRCASRCAGSRPAFALFPWCEDSTQPPQISALAPRQLGELWRQCVTRRHRGPPCKLAGATKRLKAIPRLGQSAPMPRLGRQAQAPMTSRRFPPPWTVEGVIHLQRSGRFF